MTFVDSKSFLAIQNVSLAAAPVTTAAPRFESTYNTGRFSTYKWSLIVGKKYAFQVSAPGYTIVRLIEEVSVGRATGLQLNLQASTADEQMMSAQKHENVTGDFLYGYAADFFTHKPVAGVRVRVLPSGATTTTSTDGFYSLEIPVSAEEDDPSHVGSVIATHPGYVSYTYPQLRLERGVTGGGEPLNIPMFRGVGSATLPLLDKSGKYGLGTGPPPKRPLRASARISPELERWLNQ